MGSVALTSTKPTSISTQEEDDPPNPSAALLPLSTDSSSSLSQTPKPTTSTVVFIALVVVTCIALSAASAFAFLFFSHSSSSSSSQSSKSSSSAAPVESIARPLTKLNHPVVLLISSDGFRFGYQFKTPTPNIGRLIANGTKVEKNRGSRGKVISKEWKSGMVWEFED